MGEGLDNHSARRARSTALLERLLDGPPLVSKRLRPWVALVSVVALLCLAGVGFAARDSSRPLLFDSSVDKFFGRTSGTAFGVANFLSDVGYARVFVTITAVIALVLVLLGDYRAAVAVFISVGLAVVLVEQVFKPFFDRRLGDLPLPTFPSGHTVIVFALTGAVALAARPSRPLGRRLGSPLRQLLVAAMLVASCSVGLSMVVLKSHYMSDVLPGVPLGLSIGGCAAMGLDAIAARWQSSTIHRGASPTAIG